MINCSFCGEGIFFAIKVVQKKINLNHDVIVSKEECTKHAQVEEKKVVIQVKYAKDWA